MSGFMMRATCPTPGTNRLTERLLAQGVRMDDISTWPEGVWLCEAGNFVYSREYRFMPTWESPCGLLIKEHGDIWGDTWVNGEFKCAENDNPLFACPVPGKPCQHRLKLPPGMNCQFHRTERTWTEDVSVERLREERDAAVRRQWEADIKAYPEWSGVCINIKTEYMPDGSVRSAKRFRLDNCIAMRCQSTQCVCRLGARRDIRPANIYYDMYVERIYDEGIAPYSIKNISKGMKVFDRPVAWTDAEIALRIWRHDPDSIMLPQRVSQKLNALRNMDAELHKEAFFVRHHRCWDGHENVEIVTEIRNIRVARNEQRDILQDLKDVREGIAVEHRSDIEKAAAVKKSQSRQNARIRKMAKHYDGNAYVASMMMRDEKPEFIQAVKEEAARIAGKREAKEQNEAAAAAQMSFLESDGFGSTWV